MRKILILLVFLSLPVMAQSRWDRVKGDCDQKFQNYQEVELDSLVMCMKFWLAYRDVNKLNAQQRRFMASVFERVLVEGKDEDAYMAKLAMTRVGFPPTAESMKKD